MRTRICRGIGRSRAVALVVPVVFAATGIGQCAEVPERIVFNRDVRPILANKCYECHGPDANRREAELRLDVEEGLTDLREGGYRIIDRSHPERSELLRRVLSEDPDVRMPPPDFDKQLTARERAILKRWVEQGAAWQKHWSLIPPRRPALPPVRDVSWCRNAIDRFILARLEREGVAPSPEADPRTLVRRLHFDLIGLPPEPEVVAAFQADPDDEHYRRLVDRLLASEHYGERMAVYWLDLVRYADSIGYHSDNPRPVSLYRDYVIRAFNENKPFDQFTIENLAGDLLPNRTVWQWVASGYNRLLQTTEEGGAQPKEYMAKYAADRVRNVSEVWLGATMGCAECHDHKYDPYTMRDFYSLAAFFADIKEKPVGRREATRIAFPEQQRKLAEFDRAIAAAREELQRDTPQRREAQRQWERRLLQSAALAEVRWGPWHLVGPFVGRSFEDVHAREFGPEKDATLAAAFGERTWKEQPKWEDGKPIALPSDPNAAWYVARTVESTEPVAIAVSLGSDDAIRVWLDDALLLDRLVQRGVAADQERLTLKLEPGKHRLVLKITNAGGGAGFYFRAAGSDVPAAVAAALRVPEQQRTAEQRQTLADYYRQVAPELEPLRKRLRQLEKARADYENSLPLMLVTISTAPRTVRILPRGNWMDDSGPIVLPDTPACLPPLGVGGRRATRLDLARWIVDRRNPMTARVFVNRLWRLFFGEGIARTMDDLGVQGEWPSHPDLLDWLAVEFMDSGWDVKHMVRLIVTSSAYRQASAATPERLRRDPDNRLFARQGAFRLDAEFVRDAALAVSGLLVRTVGGPSVKPYQPAGYWANLNFPRRKWVKDTGPAVYRRGLYIHWQRTFLHPMLLAFDAPSREECTARRPRSNTPQQALVLLNDPQFVEAARVFAERVVRHGGPDFAARLEWAFQQALQRPPEPVERETLRQVVEQFRRDYAQAPEAARALLAVGDWPPPSDLDPAEVAAWTGATRVILNLHEFITRY